MIDWNETVRAAGVLLAMSLLAACGESAPGDTGKSSPAAQQADGAVPESSVSAGAEAPSASARAVDSETLPYADVNEQLVYGYFAFPSDMVEPLPAVVMVHDWWGLDENTRTAANRLAAEGYMVLAVDLYAGATVDAAADARQKTIGVLENPGDVQENLRQAIEFVGVAGAPMTGTVGWGFGGSWALQAAMQLPDDVDAAVIFYSQVPSDEARLSRLGGPVLALFGGKDPSISEDSISAFERSMQSLGKQVEVRVYPDAGSAFADPKRSKYDAGVTETAWSDMLQFLTAHLPDTTES